MFTKVMELIHLEMFKDTYGGRKGPCFRKNTYIGDLDDYFLMKFDYPEERQKAFNYVFLAQDVMAFFHSMGL